MNKEERHPMQTKEDIEAVLSRRLLLGELIARNARRYPDKEAVIFGDRRLTYRQFDERINRLAHALMGLGVRREDKVAILLFNCNEYLEAYFALGKIGAIAVPLNFRLHADEISYIVSNADASAFILGAPFVDTIRGIQDDLPLIRQYVSVTDAPVEEMLHYETLLA